MSDSSNTVDSLSENSRDLELELVQFFQRLSFPRNDSNQIENGVNRTDNISQSSLESNLSTETVNMPNGIPVLDIKNLCIIPQFDGNPNKLFRFINASESILTQYFDRVNVNSFQNTLLLNGILNKLEGRAEEVVAINGASNWDDIKKTLIQNFADQRDENCLNQDLVNLRQKPNETPQQFHENIMHLLNTICNYIELRCSELEKRSKRDFFTKQALKTFLAGLREPLGSTIRAMRPTSLAQALQYIVEEDNIRYYQRSHTHYSNIPTKKPMNVNQNFAVQGRFLNPPVRPYFQPQFQQQQGFVRQFPINYQQNTTQFPRGPVYLQKHPNPPTPRYPTNSQVFKRPQNPNTSQYKPTPMSVSTRNTTPQYRQSNQTNTNRNYFSNNGQKPNFIAEELFNNEHFQEPPEPDQFQHDQQDAYLENETLENIYDNEQHEQQDENFYEDQTQIEQT